MQSPGHLMLDSQHHITPRQASHTDGRGTLIKLGRYGCCQVPIWRPLWLLAAQCDEMKQSVWGGQISLPTTTSTLSTTATLRAAAAASSASTATATTSTSALATTTTTTATTSKHTYQHTAQSPSININFTIIILHCFSAKQSFITSLLLFLNFLSLVDMTCMSVYDTRPHRGKLEEITHHVLTT